jgi:protein ImuB
MRPFRIHDHAKSQKPETQSQTPDVRSSLRRFRLPIAARVHVDHHTPVRVAPSARGIPGGAVIACAGPWRSSGQWWALDRSHWDRDEWDVALADGGIYRLSRDRANGGWVIEGTVD